MKSRCLWVFLFWFVLWGSAAAKEVWVASSTLSEYSKQELLGVIEGRVRQSFDNSAITLVVYLENEEVTRRFIEEFLELNYFRTLYQLNEQVNSGRASPLLDVPGKDDAYVAVFALNNSLTYSDDTLQQLEAIGLRVVEMR